MTPIVRALLAFGTSLFRSRVTLHLEIVGAAPSTGALSTVQPAAARAAQRSDPWAWMSRGRNARDAFSGSTIL
jgi:hypothetical protein